MRQQTFVNNKPTLYLVATPIGNMGEFTPRAIEILKSVSLIGCEDTRTSKILLQHFDIKTPMTSYHEFNKIDKARLRCSFKIGFGKNSLAPILIALTIVSVE